MKKSKKTKLFTIENQTIHLNILLKNKNLRTWRQKIKNKPSLKDRSYLIYLIEISESHPELLDDLKLMEVRKRKSHTKEIEFIENQQLQEYNNL